MKTITLVKGFNAHDHFRDPDDFRFRLAVACTARWFSRATAMPNLVVPITTSEMALAYRRSIQFASLDCGEPGFDPVMTIYITPDTTPRIITEAWYAGVQAAKLYPREGTTGSGHGIYDYDSPLLHEIFSTMASCGMLLLIHAELPDSRMDPREREAAFMPILRKIHERHPKLKIVVEHISSAAGVKTVLELDDHVMATVTVHHLYLTQEDVVGNPHHLCMPVAKLPADRDAVVEFALASTKAGFGSDGAPHSRNRKEGVEQPAFGVFPGDATIPLVLRKFGAEHPSLEEFICRRMERFYGLEPTTQTITLINDPWQMPLAYAMDDPSGGVVPFMAGEVMEWRLLKQV